MEATIVDWLIGKLSDNEKNGITIKLSRRDSDILKKLLEKQLSELEEIKNLKDKIANLNPNMCDNDYADGYYAAINAVEKILNINKED